MRQSTNFASPIVSTITAAGDQCVLPELGHGDHELLAPVDRFPPRVPLADLGARTRQPPRRACQQSSITSSPCAARGSRAGRCPRSLTETPSSSSRSRQAMRRPREPGQLGLGRAQVAGRVAAAVSADRGHELALRPLELAHPLAHGNQPLGGRAHLVEGAVSLGGSEQTIGHGAGDIVGTGPAAARGMARARRRDDRARLRRARDRREARSAGPLRVVDRGRWGSSRTGSSSRSCSRWRGRDSDLLALRRPSSWPAALRLLGVAIVGDLRLRGASTAPSSIPGTSRA